MRELRNTLYQQITEEYKEHRRKGVKKSIILYELSQKYFVCTAAIRRNIDLNAIDNEIKNQQP